MSGPCLFIVVGLCNDQNNSSSSLYEISLGSYFSCMASACPVLSVQTSSYVGFVRFPPVYPTLVDFTPLTFMSSSSTPQEQPAAKVAISRLFSFILCSYLFVS